MNGPRSWLRLRLSSLIDFRVEHFWRSRDLTTKLEDTDRTIRELTSRIEVSHQGNSAMLSDLVTRVDSTVHAVQGISAMLSDLVMRVDSTDHAVQGISAMLSDLVARTDLIQSEAAVMKNRIRANPFQNSSLNMASTRDGSSTMGFAGAGSGQYVDFVEAFRPTFDALVNQLFYLRTWLPVSGIAVDLGAGRGETVQVMRDHGLSSFGIDADESVVTAAEKKGIDVRLSDIDTFLDNREASSLDVVTAIQVVEHVNADQLESWLEKIHRVLKPGGIFIAETPNPHAIDAFKAFWVDVTHVRPYYPESLLHMAQSAGFSRAEIWAPGEQDNVTDRLEFAGSYTLIATA